MSATGIRLCSWLVLSGAYLVALSAEPAAPGKTEDKVPPPYVFSLGGIPAEDVAKIKEIPGVLEVAPNGNRTRVVWRPFNLEGEWGRREKWIKGAEKIFDYLVVRKAGIPPCYGGGRTMNSGASIVTEQRSVESFSFRHSTEKVGIDITLRCYNEALLGQVEHEMLRGVPGTKVTIEKYGEGYVIVSREGPNVFVVWQVSEQMFVQIRGDPNREVIAAYIARLGCITPKDYKVSVDTWVQNEIKWRIMQLHWTHEYETKNKLDQSVVTHGATNIATFFPECLEKVGRPKWDSKPGECWPWIQKVKGWLWANRLNFRRDDWETIGYVLKGPDLYNPQNPPALPPELQGPPKPE